MARELSKEELEFSKTHKHYGEMIVEMLPVSSECKSCEIGCTVGVFGGRYTEVGVFCRDPKNIRKDIKKGLRDTADCKAWTGNGSLHSVSTVISFEGGDSYERLFSTMCLLTEESIQEIEAKITGQESPKIKKEKLKVTEKKILDKNRYSKSEFLKEIYTFLDRDKNARRKL